MLNRRDCPVAPATNLWLRIELVIGRMDHLKQARDNTLNRQSKRAPVYRNGARARGMVSDAAARCSAWRQADISARRVSYGVI